MITEIKMDERIQGHVILKRNKFGTFLNLLLFVILLLSMILLLKGGDYEVFLPPYEDMGALIGISFTIITLIIVIIICLFQLTKKGELIANEEGITDYYSIFSREQVYPRETIESITYKRSTNSKSLSRRIIIRFSGGEKKKIFILPMLTRMGFDIGDVKRSIVRYGNKNGNNISVTDYTKDRGITGVINNLGW